MVVNGPPVRSDRQSAVSRQSSSASISGHARGSPYFRAVLIVLLAVLLTHACNGGDDGTSPGETAYLTGTYVGDYTVSSEPGTVYRAGLTLVQTGRNLRGQLTTDGLRTAIATLTLDGSTLTGELEYTDDCPGSAQLTASIQAGGDRIVGGYSASDCGGEYTGTFDVLRRTGQRSPPSVTITAPQDGSTFIEGSSITFEGSGTDPDGGSVSLAWRSNLQGFLGRGSPLHTDRLSAGEHTISLVGIDDEVQIRAAAIRLSISDYLTGTYVGDFTASIEPDTVYRARFSLTQTGHDLGGQLNTSGLRTALVSLTIDGSTATGGLEFTDDCPGSADVTAAIQADGPRIVGSYSASDCSGQYLGTFDVVKHVGHLTRPNITIREPEDGSIFPEDSLITFRGTGHDPDGGAVTLLWRSSIDGDLGTGSLLSRGDLSLGTHTIELLGIDDDAQLATRSIAIDVVTPIDWPLSPALDFHLGSSTETPDADDLDLAAAFTIEMWVRPTNAGYDPPQHLVSKWGTVDDAAYQLAIGSDRKLQFGTRDSRDGSNTFAYSVTPLEDNVWQHVAAVFDNGEARLYIQGLLDADRSGMHDPQATDQTVSLGRERSYNPEYYSGLMDEVRIWNVARTAAEIAANMNVNLTGSEPGLVAYWPMNEGAGDTVFDLTGNGHDMRLGDTAGPDGADPTWVWPWLWPKLY